MPPIISNGKARANTPPMKALPALVALKGSRAVFRLTATA
jgi:hypothetical protein